MLRVVARASTCRCFPWQKPAASDSFCWQSTDTQLSEAHVPAHCGCRRVATRCQCRRRGRDASTAAGTFSLGNPLVLEKTRKCSTHTQTHTSKTPTKTPCRQTLPAFLRTGGVRLSNASAISILKPNQKNLERSPTPGSIQMADVYRVLLCYCNTSNRILNVKYNQVYSFNGLSICIIASGCEPTIYFLYIFKVYV